MENGIDDIPDLSHEEVTQDIKDIDIECHPLYEDSIKNETLPGNILETVILKTENAPFIKIEDITESEHLNNTEDTNNNGNDQEVELEGNLKNDLNGSTKAEHPEKTDFAGCYEEVKIIKQAVVPVKPHEYITLANDKHVCNHCQQAYKRMNSLKMHIRNKHRPHKTKADVVHQDLKYRCDKCYYKTYRHENLKAHKIIHLKPEEIQYFYCYHCNYKCSRKSQLKRHILKKHGNVEKRYGCKKCSFETEHHYKLKLHELSHKTKAELYYRDLKYRCNECDYKTHKIYSLKRHKLIHLKSEEIPYFYCYHCSYKSKQKDNLKYHILRHFNNGEIAFDCYICNFMTPNRESIIDHIKTHSKDQIKSDINEGS